MCEMAGLAPGHSRCHQDIIDIRDAPAGFGSHVGESGYGKSATGLSIMRLIDADAGEVHLDGDA
jgi:ABC-type glutathione transport system ATPase component